MADMIAGPGQGLPPPQAVYPPELWTTPYTAPTNRFTLQSAQALLIPAGTWIIEGGDVTRVQWKDPVNRMWHNLVRSPAIPDPTRHWGITLRSDGFNYRLANTSGVAVGAEVTTPGAGYVPHTTFIVPSAGNGSYRAIVGGALGAVDIINGGKNYSIPPIVFVPAPPFPGLAATGHAVLTNGVVTSVVWDDPGAGYPFAPEIVFITDPFDPVMSDVDDARRGELVEPARGKVHLTGFGTLTGVLLVRAGESLAVAPTLTVSGQGTGAAASPLPLVANWVAPQDDECTIQPSSGP